MPKKQRKPPLRAKQKKVPGSVREESVAYCTSGPPAEKKPTFIDLFCGCGGFTLGMQRAGFDCLAAIDFNAQAVATLKENLPDVGQALELDLTKYNPDELAKLIGTDHVDVIVGGPPCQGFSTARQRDGSNHGERLKADPRRKLYREYLRFVDYFQPRIFVIENVLGIRTAAGGEYFTRVQKEARELGQVAGKPGYRVHSQIEDAWELGVPQKRRRQLIIGVRADLHGYFPTDLKPVPRAIPKTNLGAAICDLPALHAGQGQDESEYDLERREKNIGVVGDTAKNYLFKVLEVKNSKGLCNHVARPHSDRDLRDFALLREGENSATAMRDRGVEFEFPYDRGSFKDRYTRQSRSQPCSTIVAHLSKDGLMFIHPTQKRSLTPREAARIQSFPDWFRFPKARTHSFRLIGNAVPPLIGEAIGLAVKEYLMNIQMDTEADVCELKPLPKDRQKAVAWITPLLDMNQRALRLVNTVQFKKCWCSIAFLYGGLHPDSALEHGDVVSNDAPDYTSVSSIEPRLLNPYYEQSGWPVILEPVAKEAWRRYEKGELQDDEFYCVAAQRAGMIANQREAKGA
ncbi:MAG: DNA cytosine methyltransferase [bacterium]